MKKTKKNFTLVELLCAVALVVILAGIGFSTYSYASHRGKEAATRSLITRLEAGLETLKTKHGFYPATGSGTTKKFARIEVGMNDSGIITEVKFISDTQTTVINKAKQLKDFLSIVDAESLKKNLVKNGTGDEYDVVDAWGGKIYYAYPGFFNTAKYDIVAPGADGNFTTNTTTDVLSPPNNNTDTNYKNTAGEWACDDIANFDKL